MAADELLPQRSPFLMADTLLYCDEDHARTRFEVRADNVFVRPDGRMHAAGLIEVMAQGSAARIGYISKYIRHQPIQIGYIGAITQLEVVREPNIGEVLETSILVVADMGSLTQVEAQITSGNETIAQATLKMAIHTATQ